MLPVCYPTISLVYPALHIIKQQLECNVTGRNQANINTIVEFKDAILSKLRTSHYSTGYETSLPMLASALDPRFKNLHFVDSEDAKQNIYCAVKAKIVGWTMTRQRQQHSPVASSSTSTIDMPSTSIDTPTSPSSTATSVSRQKVYDLFSGLTQSRNAGHNSGDTGDGTNTYEKVKAAYIIN